MTNKENINEKLGVLISRANDFCESCENLNDIDNESYKKIKSAITDIERYRRVGQKQQEAARANLSTDIFKSASQAISWLQMTKNALECAAIILQCLQEENYNVG